MHFLHLQLGLHRCLTTGLSTVRLCVHPFITIIFVCTLVVCRFYHTNHVRRFKLKRPFHQGIKDKENEYKVSDNFTDLSS